MDGGQDVEAAVGVRVMGLDLSLTGTGVARPDGTTWTVRTRARDKDRRLVVIAEAVRAELAALRPDVAVVEDLPVHAHASGRTGMVHGVVRAELVLAGVPYVLLSPATLKAWAVGKGNADKARMVAAAVEAGAVVDGDDNRADAWWLRAAGAEWYGQPVADVPEGRRGRLAVVEWPDLRAPRPAVGVLV